MNAIIKHIKYVINIIPDGTKFLYREHEYIKLPKHLSNPSISLIINHPVENACCAVHVNTGEIYVFTNESVEIQEKH